MRQILFIWSSSTHVRSGRVHAGLESRGSLGLPTHVSRHSSHSQDSSHPHESHLSRSSMAIGHLLVLSLSGRQEGPPHDIGDRLIPTISSARRVLRQQIATRAYQISLSGTLHPQRRVRIHPQVGIHSGSVPFMPINGEVSRHNLGAVKHFLSQYFLHIPSYRFQSRILPFFHICTTYHLASKIIPFETGTYMCVNIESYCRRGVLRFGT